VLQGEPGLVAPRYRFEAAVVAQFIDGHDAVAHVLIFLAQTNLVGELLTRLTDEFLGMLIFGRGCWRMWLALATM